MSAAPSAVDSTTSAEKSLFPDEWHRLLSSGRCMWAAPTTVASYIEEITARAGLRSRFRWDEGMVWVEPVGL